MPVSYSLNDNIIVIKFTGKYSTDEMKQCIRSALSDDNCRDDAVLLMDLREDTSVLERNKDEIRQMSFFIKDIKDKINNRLCMVTDNDLAFGLMNMAKVYDESLGLEANVFSDFNAALVWLKRPTTDAHDEE